MLTESPPTLNLLHVRVIELICRLRLSVRILAVTPLRDKFKALVGQPSAIERSIDLRSEHHLRSTRRDCENVVVPVL
jgi:hypothetical protein